MNTKYKNKHAPQRDVLFIFQKCLYSRNLSG